MLKVKRKDIEAIVNATFPSYTGRKFKIEARENVTLFDLNWSGGSRSQYRTCTIDGNYIGGADRYNAAAPWDHNAEGARIPIPNGAVIVRHSIFMGKDTGLTIYVNPGDMPRLLPSP